MFTAALMASSVKALLFTSIAGSAMRSSTVKPINDFIDEVIKPFIIEKKWIGQSKY